MVALSQWATGLGAGGLLAGAALLAAPGPLGTALRRLPRHVWAGRVLSAAALLWAGWLVHAEPLEFLLPYRRFILPAFVVAVPLTWLATPELLACRAVGGLLALLPAPVLVAARSHPSSWRLVVVVLMYILAIVGMLLIMSPFHLRRWLDAAACTPARLRLCGAVGVVVGVGLVWLGRAVFAAGGAALPA